MYPMTTFSPHVAADTFNNIRGSLGGSSRAQETLGARRSSPGKFSIHNAIGPNNAFFAKNANNFLGKDIDSSYNQEGGSSQVNQSNEQQLLSGSRNGTRRRQHNLTDVQPNPAGQGRGDHGL
jgi:hypothetical protein